jgi:hypothetical protein
MSLEFGAGGGHFEHFFFFFPVPVCAITVTGVPGGTFVSMNLLVSCAGD